MKLTVELANCYGIKQLSHTFDFTDHRVYSIYAPNGFMKTSFARTFLDISQGREPRDLIYPEREPKWHIKTTNDDPLIPEHIFVIEPYNSDFTSERVSLLLVNQEIKEQYDHALASIETEEENLFRKLRQLSGITSRTLTPQMEMLKCFGSDSIYDLLESLEKELKNVTSITYHPYRIPPYSLTPR